VTFAPDGEIGRHKFAARRFNHQNFIIDEAVPDVLAADVLISRRVG
jgi:hypothetical protein